MFTTLISVTSFTSADENEIFKLLGSKKYYIRDSNKWYDPLIAVDNDIHVYNLA